MEDAADCFRWLAEADWLLRTPAPGDRRTNSPAKGRPTHQGWPESERELRGFLQRFGNIFESHRPRGTLVERARDEFRRRRGEDVDDPRPLAITATELTLHLMRLRQALDIVAMVRAGDERGAMARIEAWDDDSAEILLESARDLEVAEDEVPAYVVKSWLAFQVMFEGLETVVVPDRPGLPARLAYRPATAAHLLWLMLAVSLNALEPPFEVPGVHRCANCDSVFIADRSGVRGENVFCSPRCGRGFHARKRMREKRAAEKAARAETRTGKDQDLNDDGDEQTRRG